MDLQKLGWTNIRKAYAVFHGISLNEVDQHLRLPRMCSHPDIMDNQLQCRWPVPRGQTLEITYSVIGTHHNFSLVDFKDLAAIAWSRWANVANIKPQYVVNDRTANVMMSAKYIDGKFGILGQSELPCSPVQTLNQWFDDGDEFAAFDGSNPAKIDITRVMTHELGHILGMEHIATGNLLAPIYNDNIWVPQAGDIAQMQARYPGSIPTPSQDDYTIHIKGSVTIDGYRLSKLV